MKIISYFANNKGRGDNNVTLYYVTDDTPRAGCCREQDKIPYEGKTLTSGWYGRINASKRVMKYLGAENEKVVSNYQKIVLAEKDA